MHRLHPVSLAARHLRKKLRAWYKQMGRDLPWRQTNDPYHIWLSEVMLQQTRVAAVLPYYERFLCRFPSVRALADAPEEELLGAWAGLGYYSRARNLQKAAQRVASDGFPRSYDAIRELPGIGDYTAAAIASIAFGLPHAVVDGNVLRVLSRLSNDSGDIARAAVRGRLEKLAAALLDRRAPGDHNQAMMELGATVCVPRNPQCLLCPLAEFCEARCEGTARQLPIKMQRTTPVFLEKALLCIEKNAAILMWQRGAESARMRGFWELPEREQLPSARVVAQIGEFRHTITHHHYQFAVLRAEIDRAPAGFHWISTREVSVPVSTVTRKALALKSTR